MIKSVLHVMNYAASYRGNFIESIECLQRHIRKDNLDVYYLFLGAANNAKAKEWIDEMAKRGNRIGFLTGNMLKDACIIKSIIKREKIVLIHTHFVMTTQYLSVWLATMCNRIPIIMHMHNHSKEVKSVVGKYIRRYLYKKCKMIACSASVLESIERDFPENEKRMIENGINFSRLDEMEELSAKEIGIDEDSKKLLIFGFDFYRKGVDLAISVVKKLRQSGKNYVLLISLSTNFKEVEKIIKSMLGDIPPWIIIIQARNDVATLLNFVDVFLSPSREEGLPYSVLEAGYAKCGVVMSNISAQKNIEVPFGVWFKSEDIDDFARKIEEALCFSDEKVKSLKQVQQRMISRYSVEKWSCNVRDYYNSILYEE